VEEVKAYLGLWNQGERDREREIIHIEEFIT
jgi:hypothetical protein